ncbi:hypothetical protein WMY93_019292 [Mugilogobius chulae]|uniref:Uncharacterized protein n=1 Tax=Mugilogobius chulae TaxID=88201 RepID=A0AAW0NHZ7_9GOBI
MITLEGDGAAALRLTRRSHYMHAAPLQSASESNHESNDRALREERCCMSANIRERKREKSWFNEDSQWTGPRRRHRGPFKDSRRISTTQPGPTRTHSSETPACHCLITTAVSALSQGCCQFSA